jgi:hypothetical protein
VQDMKQEIDEAIGDFDVARGRSSGSITSRSGLELLAEYGDAPVTAISRKIHEAFGEMASMVLEVYADKVILERDAQMSVDPTVPETVRWTGEALLGQTRAIVPFDAVAPRSGAVLMQMAMDLWKAGIITDDKAVARLADLPGLTDMMEVLSPQTDLAARENHEMAAGGVPMVEEWHDHAVHIAEHNKWRASTTYAALSPKRKAFAEKHLAMHDRAALAEAFTQEEIAMISPAAAGAARSTQPPTMEQLLSSTPGAMPLQGGVQPDPMSGRPDRQPEPTRGGPS